MNPAGLRYVAKTVQIADEQNHAIPVTMIMLVNRFGLPERITQLHNYLAEGPNLIRPFSSTLAKRAHYLCKMANYCLFEHYDEFGISSILDIDRSMMTRFFEDYASNPCANGKLPGKDAIDRCIDVNAFTMAQLVKHFGENMKLVQEDLLREKRVFIPQRNEYCLKLVPNFEISGGERGLPLLRDISIPAFNLLLSLAFEHARDIAFGICIQAVSGARPSEVCNIRQDSSCYGPGIIQDMDGCGHAIPVLDLRHEYVLRSDNVSVGGIKKERLQKVYPDFVPLFNAAYERHRIWLSEHSFESRYAPMFVNNNGMAMTYNDYLNRFNTLVSDWFCPALKNSSSKDLQEYGKLVTSRGLAPHIGRHVFTVLLVLRGLTPEQLKMWRGDTSVESAMTYWANKGELLNITKQAGQTLLDISVMNGEIKDG